MTKNDKKMTKNDPQIASKMLSILIIILASVLLGYIIGTQFDPLKTQQVDRCLTLLGAK